MVGRVAIVSNGALNGIPTSRSGLRTVGSLYMSAPGGFGSVSSSARKSLSYVSI